MGYVGMNLPTVGVVIADISNEHSDTLGADCVCKCRSTQHAKNLMSWSMILNYKIRKDFTHDSARR